MNAKDLLKLVKEAEGNSYSLYELAANVAAVQKEIDAALIEVASPLLKEVANLIRETP